MIFPCAGCLADICLKSLILTHRFDEISCRPFLLCSPLPPPHSRICTPQGELPPPLARSRPVRAPARFPARECVVIETMHQTVQEADSAGAEPAVAPHAGRPAPIQVASIATPPLTSPLAWTTTSVGSRALGVSGRKAFKRVVRRVGSGIQFVERHGDCLVRIMTINGRPSRAERIDALGAIAPSSTTGAGGQRLVGRHGRSPTWKDGLIAVWCENDGASVALTLPDAEKYMHEHWDRLFWPFTSPRGLTADVLELIDSIVRNACSPTGGESHVWRREDTDSYRLVRGTTALPCVPPHVAPRIVGKYGGVDVPRGAPSPRAPSSPFVCPLAEGFAGIRENSRGADAARGPVLVSPVRAPAPPLPDDGGYAEARQMILQYKEKGVNELVTIGLSARGLAQSLAAFLICYDVQDEVAIDRFRSLKSALEFKFHREGLIGPSLLGDRVWAQLPVVGSDGICDGLRRSLGDPNFMDFSGFRTVYDFALRDFRLPKHMPSEGIALKQFYTRCRMAEN